MQKIFCFPLKALKDNYIWVLGKGKKIIVVDPGDAEPVITLLQSSHYELESIILTHHHNDHVQGATKLRSYCKNTCKTYGPNEELGDIVDQPVKDNDLIEIHNLSILLKVIKTPGHTLDHICYYQTLTDNEDPPRLFCGDTLFSCGCGRIMQGQALQMFKSIKKLTSLPENTLIYSAHEYTLANIKFAQYIDENNQILENYKNTIEHSLKNGIPTLPSVLSIEKKINPFLRTHKRNIKDRVSQLTKHSILSDEKCFSFLREIKDKMNLLY